MHVTSTAIVCVIIVSDMKYGWKNVDVRTREAPATPMYELPNLLPSHMVKKRQEVIGTCMTHILPRLELHVYNHCVV